MTRTELATPIKLTDLSIPEIIQIVTDIFKAKKVTNIKIHKKDSEITCKAYLEWETTDDNGKQVVYTAPSEIIMLNPFDNDADSLLIDDDYASFEERQKFKQFCFAKGIYETAMIENNPYIKKTKNRCAECEKKYLKDLLGEGSEMVYICGVDNHYIGYPEDLENIEECKVNQY